MNTYLFHSSLSLSIPSRAIMYDEALKLSKEGVKIKMLYCDTLLSQCFINICGDSALCSICKSYFKSDQTILKNNIDFVSMSDLVTDEQRKNVMSIKFEYNNIEEIGQLSYEGINIGLGVVSAYLSVSRNLKPLINDKAKIFFDECLRNAILTIIALNRAIDNFSPQKIYLFNGRFADSRPVWEIALTRNIPFTTLEAVSRINKKFRSKFENAIPHSINYRTKLINDFWDNKVDSQEQKMQIGASFFERRRNAQYSGDKIYVINQQRDLLPDNFQKEKHNIVIFNSSEDEFASIGAEFSEKALFKSQLDGLKFIKEQLKNNSNINVTLRIHPNLSKIKYRYATELLSLRDENFDVIEGDSPISSYALLEAADSVIVFGSTMGIEAVYWKKPSILLGGALYYNLGCCYTPQTDEELIQLLHTKLQPKDTLPALKYGYYIMNEHIWESPSDLDFYWKDFKLKFGKYTKTLQINNWQKTLGSRCLFSIKRQVKNFYIKALHKFIYRKRNRLELPIIESEN